MDIDLLKTFVEVVRTRHFGKAAENVYYTVCGGFGSDN